VLIPKVQNKFEPMLGEYKNKMKITKINVRTHEEFKSIPTRKNPQISFTLIFELISDLGGLTNP
jgi:hypothetical protein